MHATSPHPLRHQLPHHAHVAPTWLPRGGLTSDDRFRPFLDRKSNFTKLHRLEDFRDVNPNMAFPKPYGVISNLFLPKRGSV